MFALMAKEFELLEQFRDMSLVCELSPQSVMLGMLKINNEFLSSIKEAQKADVKFVDLLVGEIRRRIMTLVLMSKVYYGLEAESAFLIMMRLRS